MMKLRGYVMVGALCALCAIGCKKKAAETPAAGAGSGSGSGSAMVAGSGSAESGSGSGSTEAGSGSAMAGSGSAMAGSGSAEAGSGSAMAGSGSAMAGSGSAGDTASTPPADPEGARHWSCKKDCKLALECKSAADFHDLKECEQDCASLAKDKDGRYARGSAESAAYYTCIDKAGDCAGVKKCDHPR